MSGERCGRCKYWKIYPVGTACRRYPPMPISESIQAGNHITRTWNQSVFPSIGSDGWCGEFSLAPNAETGTQNETSAKGEAE